MRTGRRGQLALGAPRWRLAPARGGAGRLLLFALTGALVAPAARAVQDVVITTGPPSGLYHPLGLAIGEVLDGVAGGAVFKAHVATSPGSAANLRRLVRGEAQFAIVQGDVLYLATAGSPAFPEPLGSVRALAVLYPEAVHLIARRQAGIRTIDDLRGKRVAVGEEGSGTALTVRGLLQAAGLGLQALQARRVAPAAMLAELAAGTLDAGFVVSAVGAPALVELFERTECTLAPLVGGGLQGVIETTPYLYPSTIPPGTYPGQREPVATAGMDAILVTTEEAPADLVYEVVAQLHRHAGSLAARLPSGVAVLPGGAVERLPVALHLGAMSYYRAEGQLERPLRVHVGVFVRDVWGLDIKHGSWSADFEIWFKWRGRLDADNDAFDFDLINGVILERTRTDVERLGGWTRVVYRVRAEMRASFLLHNYPFDTQALSIQIEHPSMTTRELLLVPDQFVGSDIRNLRKTGYAPGLKIGDWEVYDVGERVLEHTYPSDFGSLIEPGGGSRYARYVFAIALKRHLWSYLLKFSIPLVLIALMSYAVFFMHPEAYETQILVIIWVLFTAVEFHIYQSENLPEIGYMVTADMFFIWTYVAVLLLLVATLVRHHIYTHTERARAEEAVRGITRAGRLLYPLVFFGPIAALIAWSR
ncbi:MAG: hypothetical protein KatS3mg102_1351 [Planctomycetota bacterium]|nr:MAG: hypothetical protein KatS3mg102_1351 [Planctomycetota bacterium]